MILNKKRRKVLLNVTIDAKIEDMIAEIRKEFEIETKSHTVNEILEYFKDYIWNVPEERAKLSEKEEEAEEEDSE